jgi:hypothetical protein
MIWLSWRQQRTETRIALGILALLAVVLIPTGINMASAFHHDGLAACSAPCMPQAEAFASRFSQMGDLIAWLTLIPGVIGILLAAPFINQLEAGTYRLDWTQSITRGRWIAGKLGLAIGTALLAALVLTVLVTWWRAPFVHLQGRVNNSIYDSEGTVVFAYTLFALGLAAALGAVWRRAVPALIAAFSAYFAIRLFVDSWLRQRLVTPVTTTWNVHGRAPDLHHAWVMSQYTTTSSGRKIPFITCPHGSGGACEPRLKSGFVHAVYQPASHFWALQVRETALFGLVALMLLGFAAWWTYRRSG